MKTTEPRPLPDQAARDAIAADLGTTILVEAAAGTGKTESLVARMVALVRTGIAPVERISAVTFTIKAAAELSQRFQTRLEQAARGAGPEERPRLEDALARLDAAFVGTIHAFCARLLRERPVEAGVDPGFSEMDQPEDTVARQEAWERYTERLFSEDSPVLARLSALGVKLEELRQTFEALSENEDVEPALDEETPPPDFAAARRAVAGYLDLAAVELSEAPPPDGWTSYQEAVRRALRLSAFVTDGDPASFVRLAEVLERAEAQAKDAGRLRGQFEALVRDTLAPAILAWREHLYPILIAIVAPAVRDYAAWRRRNGRLNFQDLLLLARDLLRGNPAVRRAFQQRFLPILVDEFQDTDPIQAEILLYLTGSDTTGKDWRTQTPLPGSLFVVGDPKQSIYRFRRADIETYGLVRSRIEKGGRVLALTTNFRATGRLCDWVNTVFQTEFPAEASPEQAPYAALEPHRDPGGPPVFRLETRTATPATEPVVEQDARRIASVIAAAVAAGQRRPADFLVLFRTRWYMSTYARELEARGLPYELAGGGAFEDSEELQSLLSVLAAISDPDDPVPFIAALRGPIFGIDDEALYRHSAAGGRFSFRASMPAAADPRIANACKLIAEGEALAVSLPPGAAVARICAMLGSVAVAAARELGDSRAGNLLKALAAARTLSAEGLDFPAVVRELTRMTRAGYIEEMSAEPGRRDAVRLMTVHGAKGLEAPVVFLADPRTDRPKAPRYWIDRSGPARGFWLVVRETDGFAVIPIARPAGWEAMAEREKRFEEAERKRLLYVAATRAREMLVVSTWRQGKGKPKGAWSTFDAYLREDLPEPAEPAAAGPPPPLRDLPAEAAAFRERRVQRQAVSSRASYSVSSVTHIAHVGTRPAWERTGRGMSWGRVLHRLLEALMRDGKLDVRAYAANLLAEEERSAGDDDVDEIVRTVEGVRASELWKRAAAAPRRLVEVPFALSVRREELGLADGPAETLLQGAIDLVFEEDGAWTLVDYKSDTVGDRLEELVAFYTPQIAIYRRYWERLTGRTTRAGLFFAQTGQAHWLAANEGSAL